METKTFMVTSIFMVALMLFAFPVMAEDDNDNEKMEYTTNAPTWIRAAHLSPDAPNVDVLANGGVLFGNVAFEDVAKFTRVKAGDYNVQVVPTGETEPVVIEADLKLKPWRLYSVLAVNTLSNIEPIVIEDRIRYIPRKSALVRFVHASPDAPEVDIAVKDGPVLFSEVEFKEVEDYIRVNKGTYDLEVRLARTDTVVLELDNIELTKGTAYTVFATGEVSEGTLNAVVVKDRSSLMNRWLGR